MFRFENFWIEHDGFLSTVQNSWSHTVDATNSARIISAKFKKLRGELKRWSKSLSNLSLLVDNCNKVICFLDDLEDRRLLFNPEINLRNLVKVQVQTLLKYKNAY